MKGSIFIDLRGTKSDLKQKKIYGLTLEGLILATNFKLVRNNFEYDYPEMSREKKEKMPSHLQGKRKLVVYQ